MTPPLIIGLTGSARSGKTTIAEHLRDEHGFTILSFADPLKAMLKRLDPIIGVEEESQYAEYSDPIAYPVHLSDYLDETGEFLEEADEDWIKVQFPEYRRLLQQLGTDCIRSEDPDFWVDRLDAEIVARDLRQENLRVVIADVRFPNESELIRDWDGKLVNVYRPGNNQGQHTSEAHAGMLGEETMILNDAKLEDLLGTVDAYLETLTR